MTGNDVVQFAIRSGLLVLTKEVIRKRGDNPDLRPFFQMGVVTDIERLENLIEGVLFNERGAGYMRAVHEYEAK